ncbi:MAG: D-cysteine desulfhydrase family protein [Chloroflexota bacterium]
MNLNFPRSVSLGHFPTPIEKLDRLSRFLNGPELFIKRDDLTGLATGGNKTRKLEFLIADAIHHECDHIVTVGGPQSNHCRQTAAAAAKLGLGCSLIIKGEKPKQRLGNLLLDELLGAHVYWTNGRTRAEMMEEVVAELQKMGRKPYPIPVGGSNVIGSASYVAAMEEFHHQIRDVYLNFDFIVLASSSGGTQAGIVLGSHIYGFNGEVLGISVDGPADQLKTQVAALATATATHLGLDSMSLLEQVVINDDYIGDGYAQVGEPEREAIQLMAQKEGILLDPVYTSKAVAGIIDLIRWGAFTRGQSILFWHTGGSATLSAFSHKLVL